MNRSGKAFYIIVFWFCFIISSISVYGCRNVHTVTPIPTHPSREYQTPVVTIQDSKPYSFVDITTESGLDFLHHEDLTQMQPVGAGIIVLYYNGDGQHDAYLTDSLGANKLFQNNGDGTFQEVAERAKIDDTGAHSNGGCSADYDNDGDQDIYLTNQGTSKLFRNEGNGQFEDVTSMSGVGDPDPSFNSTGCAWGDYDRDGFLDLVISRHFRNLTTKTLVDGEFHLEVRNLVLYHNEGDGSFSDESDLLGHTRPPEKTSKYGEPFGNLWGAGFQPAWVDFDNDGDPDLYVSNDWGTFTNPNVLWRNDGSDDGDGWKFVDISKESGTGVAIEAMSIAVGDYNLDGNLDLFITNVGASILLTNLGDGKTFVDRAPVAGTEVAMIGVEKRVTWGSAFLDYDNDGLEDLYIVSGFLKPTINPEKAPDYMRWQHNKLLRNNGDGTFQDLSLRSGADDPGVGRGFGFLDIDNDGCLDLLVGNLGGKAKLFRNTCQSGNSWIITELVGTSSNRDGIGARITLEAGGKTQIREVSGGRSFMGQNMRPSHFGLGTSTKADRLTIKWPSGIIQTLTDIPAGRKITITEPIK